MNSCFVPYIWCENIRIVVLIKIPFDSWVFWGESQGKAPGQVPLRRRFGTLGGTRLVSFHSDTLRSFSTLTSPWTTTLQDCQAPLVFKNHTICTKYLRRRQVTIWQGECLFKQTTRKSIIQTVIYRIKSWGVFTCGNSVWHYYVLRQKCWTKI